MAQLKRPVHAKLFTPVVDQIPDEVREAHSLAVRVAKGVLQALVEGSDGRFSYEVVELDKRTRPQERLDAVSLLGAGDDSGVVFALDELKGSTRIDWYDPSKAGVGLEFRFANAIRGLSMRAAKRAIRVGQLVGHHEPRLSDPNLILGLDTSMRSLLAKNHALVDHVPDFEVVDVDLQRGDAPVNPELEGLLIVQPELALTEKELHRIDEFVLSGRKLFVAASAVNVSPGDRAMHAVLDTHGLSPLLLGYGMELREDIVLDNLELANVEPRRCDRSPAFIYAQCPSPSAAGVNHSACGFAPFFFDSPELALTSSLVLRADKQPEEAANLRAVATTSSHGQRRTGPVPLNPLQKWVINGTEERIVVAATISGRIRSAFATGDERQRVPEGESSSVVVVSAGSLFSNPYVRAIGQATNAAQTPRSNKPFVAASGLSLECAADRFGQAQLMPAFLLLQTSFDWMDMTPEFAKLSEQAWCGDAVPAEVSGHAGTLSTQTDGGTGQ